MKSKGACDHGLGSTECYVGVWRSTNLLDWDGPHKAVKFPRNEFTYNNDVTMVRPEYGDWQARHGKNLPKHQAIMALEATSKKGPAHSFAINTGTDGDLTKNWELLPGCEQTAQSAGIRSDKMKSEDILHFLGPEAREKEDGSCAVVWTVLAALDTAPKI
eukprot:SAG31_NODE_1450_length_8307_cov_3.676657_7_plen_160_part_00